MLRDIAARLGQQIEETRLQVFVRENFPRQLQRTPGVFQDLHGLQAADLIEEPAATGVHEHEVALHLQQLEQADDFGLGNLTLRMPGNKLADVLGRPV